MLPDRGVKVIFGSKGLSHASHPEHRAHFVLIAECCMCFPPAMLYIGKYHLKVDFDPHNNI